MALLARQRQPNPLLGDVVEPITIVEAISWDDGGSRGLAFKDARQVTRYACLMDDLDGHRNLILGSYTPIHDARRLRAHPVGGAEERAFLRLLEDWCRGDADARWWDRRLELYYKGEVGLEGLSEGSPSGRDAGLDVKARAVDVLRSLRRRDRD